MQQTPDTIARSCRAVCGAAACHQPYRCTDNMNRIAERTFDMMGRTVKVVENRIDGNPTETESDTDRTTEYIHDSKGRLSIQRAYNPKGTGN